MNDVELELLERTITELRDHDRVSQTVWSFAQRVGDWTRGVVPKNQWQALHQEIVAHGQRIDTARVTKTPESTCDMDRRVIALLGKSLNGDTHGMLQDLVWLLLEAYQDASVARRADPTNQIA
jgi:hypothetical protein